MSSDRPIGLRRRSRLLVILSVGAMLVATTAATPAAAEPSEPPRIVLGDDIIYPELTGERAAWAVTYYGLTYEELFGWSDTLGVLSTPPLPYGTMTDVWEVWACDTGGGYNVDLDDAVAMLRADVAPFFDTLSGGQYDLTFRKGGRVHASGHNDCRTPFPAAFNSSGVNGLLIISDRDLCGGNGGPGQPTADTYPGNSRTILVGQCSWGPNEFAPANVYFHEIGHALGWPHSYSGLWTPASDIEFEYDNRVDVMSGGQFSTVALNRYAAGWFGENQVAIGAPTPAGTEYLLKYAGASGTQMLVVMTSTTGVFFTIDARKTGGIDELPNGIANAATVHAVDHRTSACTYGGGIAAGVYWHPEVCDFTERRTSPYPASTPTSTANGVGVFNPTLGWIDPDSGLDHVLRAGDEVTLDPADLGAAGSPVTLRVDTTGASGITVTLLSAGGGGGGGGYSCNGVPATIIGSIGDDLNLNGTPGDDVIVGLGGDDEIRGMGGNDLICAGDGDDTVFANAGNDTVYGGAGDDTLRGGGGTDTLYGEAGVDKLIGGANADTIYGGAGGDRIFAGAGNDLVFGEGGRDKIDGGFDDDELHGGDETDYIRGRSGDDTMYGDGKSDFLYGGIGDDTGYGGVGNDRLFGEAGRDTLYGEAGNDQLRGQAQADILDGGPATDWCSIEPTPGVNCENFI